MTTGDTNEYPEFETYDERTDEELSNEDSSPISTKQVLSDITRYLSTDLKDRDGTKALISEMTIQPDLLDDLIFTLDAIDMREIEFDVGAINTYYLFKTLSELHNEIFETKPGIYKPMPWTTVNRIGQNMRIDVEVSELDPTIERYSITLTKVPNPNNPENNLVEICMDESHYSILRQLSITAQATRYNLVYMREDGLIRIFGDITSEDQYLLNRANTLQGIAIATILRVLKHLPK